MLNVYDMGYSLKSILPDWVCEWYENHSASSIVSMDAFWRSIYDGVDILKGVVFSARSAWRGISYYVMKVKYMGCVRE